MRRIVLAVVGMVLAAAESAATESLSAAASPAADLVVAFDTLQAEKAMDANLWKRIQSDKKRALQRSRDKSPFKTEGRDIAGTVNVSFISFSPFRFIADGVLCVSGGKGTSMREDVAMLADMAKDSGFEVSMSGGKKTPTYSFDMKAVPDDDGDEIMPVNGAVLSVLNDSQARFTARWGIGPEEVKTWKNERAAKDGDQPLAEALAATPLSDSALGLVVNAERLAELPLDGNEEQKALKELLVQLKTFALVFRVEGTDLHIGANLMFKNDEAATARRTEFAQDCEQLCATMAAQGGGMLRTITAGGEGRALTVDAAVDIRAAWALISRFENPGRKRKKKSSRK